MGTTTQKLEYLGTTKSQLKDQINYGLPTEKQITNSTTFRNYVGSIFEAFLEALRNPDTLFTNLPKTSGSGSNITLNNTAYAPMRITLNPTAITQDGTPTPSSPQDIHTISGNNSVVVDNGNGVSQTNPINLGEIEYCKIGDYEDKFVRSDGQNIFDGSVEVGSWSYTANAEAVKQTNANMLRSANKIEVQPNTDYILSINGTAITESARYIFLDKNGIVLNSTTSTTGKFTTITNCKYIVFHSTSLKTDYGTSLPNPMINKGTTALPYTPYEKGWYYKQGIGKVVLDENNTWSKQTGYYQCTINQNGIGGVGLCNYYIYGSTSIPNSFWVTANAFRTNDTTDTLENYKTWLSTHNIILYYVLDTPTYTKITGELAEQLEQVNKGMLSYDGTTNISQVNNDLAFVINASAITK